MTSTVVNLYEHTVWCVGTHDCDGECMKEIRVADGYDTVVRLQGIPGDNQYVEIDGGLFYPAHVQTAMTALAALMTDLAAQVEVEAELDWESYDYGD